MPILKNILNQAEQCELERLRQLDTSASNADEEMVAQLNSPSSISLARPAQGTGLQISAKPTNQQLLFAIKLYDSSWINKTHNFEVHHEGTPEQLENSIIKTFRPNNRTLSKVEITKGQIPLDYKEAIIRAALALQCVKLELVGSFIDESFWAPLVRIIDKTPQKNSSHSFELITNERFITFTLLPQKNQQDVCQGVSEVKIENSFKDLDLFFDALADCSYLFRINVPYNCPLRANLQEAINRNLSKLYYIPTFRAGGKHIFWGNSVEEFEKDEQLIRSLLWSAGTIGGKGLYLRGLPVHLRKRLLTCILEHKSSLQFSCKEVDIELCADVIQLIKQLNICTTYNNGITTFTLHWERSSVSFTYYVDKQKNASLEEIEIKGALRYEHEQRLLLLLKSCPHLTRVSGTDLSSQASNELKQLTEKNKMVKQLPPVHYYKSWVLLGCITALSLGWYHGLALGSTLFYTLVNGMCAGIFAKIRKIYLGKMSVNLKEDSEWVKLFSPEAPKERIDALKCGEVAARSSLAYFKHFTNKNTYVYYTTYCAGLNFGLNNDKNAIRKVQTL